jgi:hypothetical protein
MTLSSTDSRDKNRYRLIKIDGARDDRCWTVYKAGHEHDPNHCCGSRSWNEHEIAQLWRPVEQAEQITWLRDGMYIRHKVQTIVALVRRVEACEDGWELLRVHESGNLGGHQLYGTSTIWPSKQIEGYWEPLHVPHKD